MVNPARQLYRGLRAAWNRAVHPSRRRAAHALLGHAQPIGRVVFVCLGNVCRSPYAEYALKRRTESRSRVIRVASAGFIKPGRNSPDTAIDVGRARGLDLRGHTSRLLQDVDLAADDLVAVMEPGQKGRAMESVGVQRSRVLVLGDLDPVVPDRRLIPDPWGREAAAFEAAFDRIDRCLDELLPYLAAPDAADRSRRADR